MSRVRWMRAEWPSSIRTLAKRMKGRAYTEDNTDGFIIDRVRDTYLEGRYVERLTFTERVLDPFGAEQVIERVLYRTLRFSLYEGYPQIELYDMHRSVRGFTNGLLELCQFSLVIEPVKVGLIQWVESFQEIAKCKVLVTALQIADLEIEQGVTAKILVKSARDVRRALKELTGRKRYSLEKMQMQYLVGKKLATVDLSSAGGTKLDEELVDEFIPLLRESLPNAKRR